MLIVAIVIIGSGVVGASTGESVISIQRAGRTIVTADRGTMLQIDDPPPPASYSGCLIDEGERVAASFDPARRYRVEQRLDSWRILFYDKPGRRGPVVIVGDSLTDGSAHQTMRALIDAGFGPICIDGAWSRRVLVADAKGAGIDVVERIRSSEQVWASARVRWVIALGTNDVDKGASGISAFPWLIGALRSSLGALTVPAFWVEVRTLRHGPVEYPEVEDAWNAAIPPGGFEAVDWAGFVDSAADPRLFIAGDDVHLTSAGADARATLIVAALLAP